MSLIDAGSLAGGTTLRADLCIVGAGAAGLAMAVEMDGRGLDVVVLESGGLEAESGADSLTDFDNAGLPLMEDEPRRQRYFGGTTNTWYGRLARYDEIDFEARPWVPCSGWPIDRAEVLAFEKRAARFLDLEHPDALSDSAWSDDDGAQMLRGAGLQPAIHLWPRRVRTSRLHLPCLRRSGNVRLVLHAQATRLITSRDGTAMATLAARGPRDQTFHTTAHAYVIACGGWENARLLLLSRDRDGNAVGNRHDTVGRYYMNHPRNDGVARLYLDRSHPQRHRLVRGLTESRRSRIGARVQTCVRIGDERQRREQLLNACAFFYVVSAPRLRQAAENLRSLSRMVRRFEIAGAFRRLARLGSDLPVLATAAACRVLQRPFLVNHLALVDQGEQAPDPDSRITLSERCDRHGDPLLRLHWVIGADTTRSLRRLHRLLAEQFATRGVGRLESALFDPQYEPKYLDAAHPMGTTRMSADPRWGVVDTSCQVHGVGNLFIAGSSVFPTGGQSPPTLTIVCLALRLADHLRRQLRGTLSS